MKKILLILIAFIVILFSGCSPEQEPHEEYELSIYHNAVYDLHNLTLTDTDRSDILYGLRASEDEFFIAMDLLSNITLTQEEEIAYSDVLAILDEMNELSNVRHETLIEYSLEEFSEECERLGIEVSLTNVIMFSNFKELINSIVDDRGTSYIGVSKIHYMNARLGRILTREEKQALEFLQVNYYDVNIYSNNHIVLADQTIDDLVTYFSGLGVEFNTSEEATLETALDILKELNENPPTE